MTETKSRGWNWLNPWVSSAKYSTQVETIMKEQVQIKSQAAITSKNPTLKNPHTYAIIKETKHINKGENHEVFHLQPVPQRHTWRRAVP